MKHEKMTNISSAHISTYEKPWSRKKIEKNIVLNVHITTIWMFGPLKLLNIRKWFMEHYRNEIFRWPKSKTPVNTRTMNETRECWNHFFLFKLPNDLCKKVSPLEEKIKSKSLTRKCWQMVWKKIHGMEFHAELFLYNSKMDKMRDNRWN